MIAIAAALLISLAAPPAQPGILLTQDRLEMRSYQPYSGLQLQTVPTAPPVERGVRRERPAIVEPTRVPPKLRRPGAPRPYTSQWYRYCARNFRSFEPRTGRYTTYSGEQRLCR